MLSLKNYRWVMQHGTEVMINFLKIDTQMGLTFSAVALVTDNLAKRERVTRSARKAYDTVVRLKKSFPLTELDADTLDRNLGRLRSELESLGETFLDPPD